MTETAFIEVHAIPLLVEDFCNAWTVPVYVHLMLRSCPRPLLLRPRPRSVQIHGASEPPWKGCGEFTCPENTKPRWQKHEHRWMVLHRPRLGGEYILCPLESCPSHHDMDILNDSRGEHLRDDADVELVDVSDSENSSNSECNDGDAGCTELVSSQS